MKKVILFILLFLSITAARGQSVRESIRLDDGWKFAFGYAGDATKDFGCGTEYFNYLTKANSIHNTGPYSPKFDDSGWKAVRLPHDWVASLPYDSSASKSHGYKTVGYKYPATSVGWYRKTLHIDKSDFGKRLSLRFDGIFRAAQVWFNGMYMGTEPSGYASQIYDISDYANYGGDNTICVRADASMEEGWFYEGAGIYRDAWLDKRAPVAVADYGTFVHANISKPYDKAVVVVETEVNNSSLDNVECTVSQTLMDADGNIVAKSDDKPLTMRAKDNAKCVQSLALNNPHLWSPTTPYIYNVKTTVKRDGRIVDEYTTPTGIREIVFDAHKGLLVNGVQTKIKGVNMHQDHAGVGSAVPEALMEYRIKRLKDLGCNAYRASHNPMSPALLDICDREGIMAIDENRLMGTNTEHIRLLENMIKRDRNHPSVILWSDGNEEWGLENNDMGRRVAASMRAYTHLLDSTRHSTVANAGGSELIKELDVVGYNYIVQNDVMNRHNQHPEWKITGTEETTGCGTRGIYEFMTPEETGAGRMASKNRRGVDGFMNVIERGWQFYDSHDWASGLFYWTGFDYRGEPDPLVYPAVGSQFGILDYCGFPKDEAWYLKSWWTNEDVLHVFPHWNLHGHEGEKISLWVYSNCDEVQLTVNGHNLGRKPMPRNGHLEWTAVYHPGKVVAKGYRHGKLVKTDIIETTGKAAALRTEADRVQIAADGRDVAVVNVSVRDAKGRVVPDVCGKLTFSIVGEGRIIGVGNGDPAYHGIDHPTDIDCKQMTIPAFNGYAQVLVQSTKTAGRITLNCQSEGLASSAVKLLTQ